MNQEIFVGIDLGTTGMKIIFMDIDGTIIAKNYVDYPILNPEQGYAEQKPSDWWQGLCKISTEVLNEYPELKDKIACIGISGQMHTQVYLDKNNCILRNAITWMDQRTTKLVERYNAKEENRVAISDNTLNSLSTTYTAPHIVWVKEEEPDIYRKTEKVLLAKDYVKYMLTGEMVTDYSDAVGTLLFNTVKKKWSEEMFRLFDLAPGLMPEVDKSAQVIGRITPEAASVTGFPEGTPVINGSADQAATSLGAGVIHPGEVTAIVGTAGVISVVSDEPIADPEHRVLCWNYCLEDKWVNLAIMQTAGESLNWFKQTFDGESDGAFDIYNQEITNITDGSEGLIFLPYLMGERSPHWDSEARGVFFGMSMKHNKYHFVKSIMEGVSFAFKNNLEVMESLGINIDKLRLLGGGSKSEEWLNIMAKVLNKKIIPVKITETGALGSSILCGLALGVYDSLDDVVSRLTMTGKEYYYEEIPEIYYKNYSKYKKIYQRTKDIFKL